MRNVIGQLNWYAVAAVIRVLAMYVTVFDGGVPNAFAVPLGLTAITSAVLALRAP